MVLVAGAELALAELELRLARIEVDVVSADADLVDLATEAWFADCKGRHPAVPETSDYVVSGRGA